MKLAPTPQEGSRADRIVPPTGFTARLTVLTAAAMAVLAVFALAVAVGSTRLADRWSQALARTATVRLSAPVDQVEAQAAVVLDLLRTTPGIATARRLTTAEVEALLAPWFGPDLPVSRLPIPVLIEVTESAEGVDATGLRARLAGEAPGAIFDDHTRWRDPLIRAAARIRALGLASLALIAAATAAMITLAAQAALAANAQVIATLRLIGAEDSYIARAFVRRFTLRALLGAAAGTLVAVLAVAAVGQASAALGGLGFRGASWLWPALVPLAAALVAFVATRAAAFRQLKETR